MEHTAQLDRAYSAIQRALITPSFAKFNGGTILSALAAESFRLSFAWWMLKRTDDVALFAAVLTISSACQIVARLGIGWIGDLFSPLKVIRGSFAIQALTMGTLGAMLFNDMHPPAALIGAFALLGFCMGARDPLSSSVVVNLVPPGEITRAMAQRGALSSVMSIVGPAFGGILLTVLGAGGAMLLSGGLVIITTVVLLTVKPIDGMDSAMPQRRPVGVAAFLYDWVTETWGGLRVFVKLRADFWLCIVICGVNLVLPALFAVVIPYLVVRVYDLPQKSIGMFDVSFALGMVLSGVKVAGWLNTKIGKRNTIAVGLAGTALPHFCFALSSSLYLNCLAMFMAGLGMLNLFSNVSGLRAAASPARYRSRIFASASFLGALSIPLGLWLISTLLVALGPQVLLLVTGFFIVVISILVYAVPDLARLMALSDKECQGAYERLYPGAFKNA